MSSIVRLDVTSGASVQTVRSRLRLFSSGFAPSVIQRVADFITGMNGVHSCRMAVITNAVQATGTITFSSIVADDTVSVNGRTYTAKTSGASGASQFNIGGSDAKAATNFQAILNADTSKYVQYVVKASSGGSGVTTITCVVAGNIGNVLPIAISAHGSVSGGGALDGGTQDAPVTLYNGL